MASVFDVDPLTGIITTYHKEDGKTILKQTQDVQNTLDMNAIDRNHSNVQGNMRKVASIPIVIWDMWKEELKAMGKNPDPWHHENRGWVISKLNSAEFQKLRTSYGNI